MVRVKRNHCHYFASLRTHLCSSNWTWIRVKRESCFFSQIPNEHKQRGLQAMGLSVAVVLGFNIGGGNIRDRLGPGQSCVSVQCMKNCTYQLVSIFVKTYVHMMFCTCQLVVILQYIFIIYIYTTVSIQSLLSGDKCVFSDLYSTTLLPLIKISWGSTITEKCTMVRWCQVLSTMFVDNRFWQNYFSWY